MISCEGVDFTKILNRYDLKLQNEMTPEAAAKKMLPTDLVFKEIAECVLYMKIKEIGPVVTKALAVKKPLDIINDGLVSGMDIVAKLYAEHVYYLPEIMMVPDHGIGTLLLPRSRFRGADALRKAPSSCMLLRATRTTLARTSRLL